MDASKPGSSFSDERLYFHDGHSAVDERKAHAGPGQATEHVFYLLPVVTNELVHQDPNVRVTALRKLQNILASGIYWDRDPQIDLMALLRNLLEWFNFPTPSAADQVLALSILTRLAQGETPRKVLTDLGAVDFMSYLKRDVSPAILPFISSLLDTLHGRVADVISGTPKSTYVPGREPDLWSISNTEQVARAKAVGDLSLKGRREFDLLVDTDSERERAKEKRCPSQSQVQEECIRSRETRGCSPLENYEYLSPHQSLAYQSVSSGDGVGQQTYIGASHFERPLTKDSFSDVCVSDALKSMMPCIALEENDNKYLFNISATLQKLDNPQALITAFKELREAVVFDFHSEALLQKFSVVQNTFEVLSKVKNDILEQVVFEFLLELVRQIKVYSQLMQLRPGVGNEGGQQPVFTLSQSLHLFVLHLVPLLTNTQHRDVSLNILYELLPLLKPSQEKDLPDKVQVHFTQYFQVLSEVLQTLGQNSGDLEALCVDQTRKRNFDSRARHCLPLLSVLTFSAELLLLLQPSHVAGLLPSYLVNALAVSAGDLIFAECTFGTHKQILPYLQFLAPEFYKSYVCALEASATLLRLQKSLVCSEEALRRCEGWSLSYDFDLESLLSCMIDAASYCSYLSDTYLIRRQIRVVADSLRIEMVKAWKERTSNNERSHTNGCTGVPLAGSSLTSVLEKGRVLILLLLSNRSMAICESAYDAVLEVSDRERWLASEKKRTGHKEELHPDEECIVEQEIIRVDDSGCLFHRRGGRARPLCLFQRFVLYSPCVLGEIMTAGLHVEATCKQAAELLFHLIQDLSEVERSELIDMLPWIECGGSLSPQVRSLVSQISELLLRAQLSLEASSQSSSTKRTKVECIELLSILRSLFSSCVSQRLRGSSTLLKVIRNRASSKVLTSWWLQKLPVEKYPSRQISEKPDGKIMEDASVDPFQHCFLHQEEEVTSSTSTYRSEGRAKSSHRKISLAGQKKVEDLLSIFKSSSVGEVIRKSAVEHLIWLIEDPSLCCLLGNDEQLFKALIFEITNSFVKDEVHGNGNIHPATKKNIFDDDEELEKGVSPTFADLGTACLRFLTKLSMSPALDGELNYRDLLLGNSFGHIWSLLPMVYHPCETARRDMAVLLSFCLFSPSMLLSGLKRMGVINDEIPSETCCQFSDTVMRFSVPAQFERAYCFPCHVVPVQVTASLSSSRENGVEEKFVHRFIRQIDLLEEGPESLLSRLEKKVSAGESLEIVEQQAFACLSVLHPKISIKRILSLLADTQASYGVEIQLLEELEGHCFRHSQAAEILARNSWVHSFQRFLARFPSTAEELSQLLKVIKLIQLILRSKSANSSGFIATTTLIKEILLPLLAKGRPSSKRNAFTSFSVLLVMVFYMVPRSVFTLYLWVIAGSSMLFVEEPCSAADLEVTILKLVVDALVHSMEHAGQDSFYQVSVRLAKDTSLLSVLLAKYVKSSSSPYICCLLAVRCFALIAKGLASFVGEYLLGSTSRKSKRSSDQEVAEARLTRDNVKDQPSSESYGMPKQRVGTAVEQDLVQIIVPLIKHMAHLHSHHYRSLRHKGLVREIVSCLWSITSFVLPPLWQELWSSTGVTYWLSRLLEDQEAFLRGMGYGILALLSSPATPGTRELLIKNWPELGDIAVRSVLNERECYAVREQSLCFLIAATTWSSNERLSVTMEENCPPASFKVIDALGINAALQRYEFWNRLPSLLFTNNGTPGFYRVLLELILNLAISDVGFIKTKIFEIPAFFKILLQKLDYGVLQPSGSGRREGVAFSRKHAADIFATKSCLGEMLLILAQDEDTKLQALIQSDVTISKLLSALDYCLESQNLSGQTVRGKSTVLYRKMGTDTGICTEHDNSAVLVGMADYERVEAIFQLSEALNLIVGKVMSRGGGASATQEISHVRVDDIRAFKSTCQEGSQGKEETYLNDNLGDCVGTLRNQLGVLRGISSLLSRIPVITNLWDGIADGEKQGHIDLKPHILLRKVQLAVCSLFGTVLSEEKQASVLLDHFGSKPSEAESHREPHHHLGEKLYNVLVRLLQDAHEEVQQHTIPQEGEFVIYLESLIISLGRALENLIAFSSKTQNYKTSSGIPATLIKFGHDVYTFLDSCGLVPKRLDTPVVTPSRSSSAQRSKHGNKVPRLTTQSNRPSRSRNSSKSASPRCPKLNERHRHLLLVELVLYVRLLKTYVYRSEKAAEECVADGIFEFIWTVWAFALCEEELMHEVLGLLSNLAAQSNRAKEIIALQTREAKKGGSLMDNVTNMIYHLPLDQVSYTTAIGLLQNLVTHAQPRAVFIRKHYFTDCLQLYRGYVRANDALRQYLMLQLFINLSAYQNGQRMFLKALPDGSMLDLILDSVEQTHYVPTSSSALFLLRNLAFCSETRFFFLCNERTFHLLLKSLESSSLEARAYASSALWILASSERRVSAALKKMGGSSAICRAYESAEQHLQILEYFSNQGNKVNLKAEAVQKIGILVRSIEQSLFALSQLVREDGDIETSEVIS
ncbi:hypothetical protein R1sor_006009 [Riccia sorocarpa]|uniref:Rotatin N-terminal domain-containing protein n=1 Tax=Riccia sorocarpa TaxID=122646 RepID=A0ABD3HL76_9MARC